MKIRFFGAAVIASSYLLSPAVADHHEQETTEQKLCIQTNLVRNFDGLDDQHVFVEERSRQYFLLTMRHRCNGLRNAQAIGLKNTTSRICSGGFGEVVFRERGIGPNTCRIETVERVENKDEARAIIAERKQYKKAMKEQKKAEEKKRKEAEKEAASIDED